MLNTLWCSNSSKMDSELFFSNNMWVVSVQHFKISGYIEIKRLLFIYLYYVGLRLEVVVVSLPRCELKLLYV